MGWSREFYVSLRVIISFCSNIHSQIKLLQFYNLSCHWKCLIPIYLTDISYQKNLLAFLNLWIFKISLVQTSTAVKSLSNQFSFNKYYILRKRVHNCYLELVERCSCSYFWYFFLIENRHLKKALILYIFQFL